MPVSSINALDSVLPPAMAPLDPYDRYAIFWSPPQGSGLARFGAAWLGWDPEAGREVAQPALAMPRPLGELTSTPRRYGFHATLKAPFRLAEGTDPAALDRAIANLARRSAPALGPRLAPSLRLDFLSLVPSGSAPQIDALAASCMRVLDGFRAEPSSEEIARRHAAGLTGREAQNLANWGYPYVLEDYRFHLTLSGRLEPGEAGPLLDAAASLSSPHLEPTLHLDDICLFGDPGPNSNFRLLRRYPLAG